MMSNRLPVSNHGQCSAPRKVRGFMLLGFLVLLALGGLSLSTHVQSASTARQRDIELNLLWVGQQYRQAVESYYLATPGPIKQLPVRLEDLVSDPRYPKAVRHIRKLYVDPLAPTQPWGVLRLNGQIIGVYSQAPGEPFRKVDFDPGMEAFNGALSYADWRFIWVPPRQPAANPGAPARKTPSSALPDTAPLR